MRLFQRDGGKKLNYHVQNKLKYMKTKYGKTIHPTQFQANIIANIKAYAARMKERAEEYDRQATVSIGICYVCKSKKSHDFVKVYGIQYVQCDKCGHVFLTKRLSQEQLNKFYEESAEYAKTYTSEEQIAYRVKNISGPKVKYAMQFAPKVKNGTWLDVGSAIGDVLKCVESFKGWKATGLEISSDSVRTGREVLGVDVRQELFQDFSRKNKDLKFDVISLFGYLEVISEPMKELALVRKHLKKNGMVVIGEANSNSFSTILQKSFPDYTTRHLIPPAVIQQFTKQSMVYALERSGLKPVAFWDFGLDFYEFIKYLTLLIPDFQNTPMYAFLMENLNDFEAIIDKKEMGDNFVMVAKAI